MRILVRSILRRPIIWVLATAGITLILLLVVAQGIHTDNGLSVWLPRSDPAIARYEKFKRIFGEDNFIAISFDSMNLKDRATRKRLRELDSALKKVPGVDRVRSSLARRSYRDRSDAGAGKRADNALSPPSSDVQAVAFYVYPDARSDKRERERLWGRIERRVKEIDVGRPVQFAGPEAINHYLDEASRRSFQSLFPVVVLLMGIVLWAATRSFRMSLTILLVSAISSVWTLGVLVLSGRSLNMVLSVLPALLVVLGTAYSLHLTTAYSSAEGATSADRWAVAWSDTVRPCFMTMVTTVAGLGALAFSGMPPVRDLGLLGGAGVLFSFGLTFIFLPAFHLYFFTAERSGRIKNGGHLDKFLRAEWIHSFRAPILVSAVLVTGLAVSGLFRLTVESDILSFFSHGHPLIQATENFEKRLIGLTPIEIWLEGPRDRVLSEKTIAAVRRFESFSKGLPDVTALINPLEADGRISALPPEAAASTLRFAFSQGVPMRDLMGRVHLQGSDMSVRLTLAVRTVSAEKSLRLLSIVENALTGMKLQGVRVRTTGAIPILVRIQASLVRTQIRTFAVSMAVITFLLSFAFRSLKLGLLSLIPNVLPILMTLGFMGYYGIPLDVSTVTVASIALGLVVDDTIHILERYRRMESLAGSFVDRFNSVFRSVGRPVVITTLALVVGFSAFVVSPFRPTHYFGLLIAGTSLFALACDLILLPALMWER